ncbi:MAG: hypothetical protein ABSH20_31285 [Tepidisphaeraceae bacterium]|jgi:hypothetical protein
MALDPLIEKRRRRAISRTLRAKAIGAGNLSAARHLVYATVAIEDDVLDEVATMIALSPHLGDPKFRPLVEGTARCIVRLRAADAAIAAGDHSSTMTSYSVRLEAQLARNLAALGLVPRPQVPNAKGAAALSEQTLARYRPTPQ